MSKYFADLRSEDELEGALLPVATKVAESSAAAAVPIATFEYETAMATEKEQQEQYAYSIPQDNEAAITDDSKSHVKLAQQTGLIAAEAEKEAIRNANRQVFSKHYHEKAAVAAANINAKERDATGLQMEFGIELPTEDTKQASKTKEATQQRQGGGYDVNEYQFGTDYQTSDYQVSEYKSVYD